MKAVKLKPIFFPNDDIFVCPPQFIDIEDDVQPEKPKNKTFSSTEQLKTILRSRQMKRSAHSKVITGEDDEDAVKKLSEWRGTASPKSALKRKFTFRKGTTSVNSDSRVTIRSALANRTMPKVSVMSSIADVFSVIMATEKFKKKKVDSESKQVTETNLDMERSIKIKISKLNQEIQHLKNVHDENLQKLTKCKADFDELNKTHEENLYNIGIQEAQELLLSDKGRKKLMKPGEESKFFMKKEKIRQQKQEAHKNYQEGQEFLSDQISNLKAILEVTKASRQECKKDLATNREELITLYCRALKDGKDLRSDGLRWIIKSLWKMNECVPLSSFPKFFDEESYQFLLTMAEKDLELETLTNKLEKLRNEIRSKRKKVCVSTERELYKTIRNRLRTISQSSVGQSVDGISLDEEENVVQLKEDFEENGSYLELSRLKTMIGEINEKMRQMSIDEVKRITELYKVSPGESAKLGVFHLIKCLVGDKVREFNKYARAGVKKRTMRIS